MRKLAPMLIATILTAAGTTFAADIDKNGNPTVAPNTQNPQGTSYSDKSNIAKGTNAIADEKAEAKAEEQHDQKAAKKKMKKADKANKTDMNKTDMNTTLDSSSTYPKSSDSSMTTPPIAPSSGTNASTVNSTTGKSGN